MRENLARALEHVFEYEGNYSDHPSDPGGATKYGITFAVLEKWRGTNITKNDVKKLTVDEAGRIYVEKYWKPIRGDLLPAGIDIAVFDCAVNQGEGRAIRLLQTAADVTSDGILGPVTLTAVNAANPEKLLHEYMALRMEAYALLTQLFRAFGLGWSRRLMATMIVSLEVMRRGDESLAV